MSVIRFWNVCERVRLHSIEKYTYVHGIRTITGDMNKQKPIGVNMNVHKNETTFNESHKKICDCNEFKPISTTKDTNIKRVVCSKCGSNYRPIQTVKINGIVDVVTVPFHGITPKRGE